MTGEGVAVAQVRPFTPNQPEAASAYCTLLPRDVGKQGPVALISLDDMIVAVLWLQSDFSYTNLVSHTLVAGRVVPGLPNGTPCIIMAVGTWYRQPQG